MSCFTATQSQPTAVSTGKLANQNDTLGQKDPGNIIWIFSRHIKVYFYCAHCGGLKMIFFLSISGIEYAGTGTYVILRNDRSEIARTRR
jgi:hypothetical protein